MKKFTLLLLSSALLFTTANAEDHKHDHAEHDHKHVEHATNHDDHDHDEAHAARLIVSDAKSNSLKILEEDGDLIASFNTIGKLSGLHTGPDGKYFYGIHRDDNRVTIIDNGLHLINHGDHQDLRIGKPYVLATLNTGKKPTHFFSHGEKSVIYNDGDGIAAVFTEDLLGKTNEMQFIQTEKPDHGAPAIINNTLLIGMLSLNRIDAYDISSGKLIKKVAECPRVHGETALEKTVYFGCTNGILVVTVAKDGKISHRHLKNPANTPENTRVGSLASHHDSKTIYGNFGQGLAKWQADAAANSAITPVKLPAKPVKFTFSENGKKLFVLTADGNFHRLDASSAKIEVSKKVSDAINTAKGSVRPSFAVLEENIYLTSPTTGELLVIAGDSLKITKRHKLGGTPALVAVSEKHGVMH